MKRTLIAIALSACLATTAAAKQLYNITLSDTSRYTDCSIIIEGSTETKFNGTDKEGFVVTKTVKRDEILVKAPVEKAEPAPQPKAEEQPKEEVKPEQPAPQAQEQPQEQPKEETPAAEEPQEQAQPAPLEFSAIADSLHKQLDEIDKSIAAIKSPKFSLERRAKRVRETVDRKLVDVEKLAQQVTDARAELDASNVKPYAFEIVTQEQRTQYAVDGKAAYDAMVADMKTGKNSRRVGGLSKFEEMRKKFQGVPEYKQAHSWYISTLKDLRKKWGKMRDTEDNRRRKFVGERREKLDQDDQKEIEKITKMLEDENEKYETAWITPSPHNARMLETAFSRVEDALRRNSNEKMDDAVGQVPEMLEKFWAEMDQAKALLDSGKCAQARELLNKGTIFKSLIGLNRDLFPEDYRKPITDQRRDLENTIRDRERELMRAKRTLDGSTSRLERAVESLERQIEALNPDIERAQEAEAEKAAEAEAAAKTAAADDEEEETEGEEEEAADDKAEDSKDADKPTDKEEK
ncbi:MAG: hypothetical protein MJ056_09475 [Akkermansia sp.]|nr:hypothetical protein [Akkermansia sp.]